MPEIRDRVTDYNFFDFLKKHFESAWHFHVAECYMEEADGRIRGYGIYKHIPRQSFIGKCVDILPFFKKEITIGFVCKIHGEYYLRLYNPTNNMVEEMADISKEYEDRFKQKVIIIPFDTDKKI